MPAPPAEQSGTAPVVSIHASWPYSVHTEEPATLEWRTRTEWRTPKLNTEKAQLLINSSQEFLGEEAENCATLLGGGVARRGTATSTGMECRHRGALRAAAFTPEPSTTRVRSERTPPA